MGKAAKKDIQFGATGEALVSAGTIIAAKHISQVQKIVKQRLENIENELKDERSRELENIKMEIGRVKALIEKHLKWTDSNRARQVLDNWEASVQHFVKVIPKDYKRMLACITRAHDQGLTGDEAIMVAFEENARDLARVGGN